MKRMYVKSRLSTDTAEHFHQDEPSNSGMHTCPSCGIMCSDGDKAQAEYYTLIDSLYDLLVSPSDYMRNKCATTLIEVLNSKVNIHVSRGLESPEPIDSGKKLETINKMIGKLLEVRVK
jgi:hypothetical protein